MSARPQERPHANAASEVVDLAASAGLHLYPWQVLALEEALAVRRDGRWVADEVGLVVPRQNGKGSVLEARQLAGLFLFRETLQVHTAHEFKTCKEHFLRVSSLVQGTPELAEEVKAIYTAAGEQAIELHSGQRLRFLARSHKSIRGFTADALYFDEAFLLTDETLGAAMPALSAVVNPQIWYTSSAPHVGSLVQHRVRRRALGGENADRLVYLEWGSEPSVSLDDDEAVALVNPSLGLRIGWDAVRRDRASLNDQEYRRERLGVPEMPLDEDDLRAIPGPEWAACADPFSTAVKDLTFGVDVSPDLRSAAVGVTGRRADGLEHWEVVRHAEGAGWVVEAVGRLCREHGGRVAVDGSGTAAALIPDLEAAGVDVVRLSARDVAAGCGRFATAVTDRAGRHLGQSSLEGAVRGASSKPMGDAWRFDRRAQGVDLTTLYCVVLASWALATVEPPAEFFVY